MNMRNPFKKKVCNNCGKEYEIFSRKCPSCQTINKDKCLFDSKPRMTPLSSKKNIFLFAVGSIGLELLGLVISFFVSLYALSVCGNDAELAETYLRQSNVLNMTVNAICYLILFVIFFFYLFKSFKTIAEDSFDFTGFLSGIIGGLVLLGSTILVGIFIQMIPIEVTNNENEYQVETLIKSFPLLSLITFVILGPICEEITYRLGLFTFLKKISTPLAYILTCLIFAFLHFDWTCIGGESATVINELLNIPSYLCAGLVLSFLYENYGLSASMTAHIINNLAAFMLTLATASAI